MMLRIKNHRGEYLMREFSIYGRCKDYHWLAPKKRASADLLTVEEALRLLVELRTHHYGELTLVEAGGLKWTGQHPSQ